MTAPPNAAELAEAKRRENRADADAAIERLQHQPPPPILPASAMVTADLVHDEQINALVPDDFEDVQDVFDNGYCAGLAVALHERTGWPIVALGNGTPGALHYLVRRPDDLLVDAHGARTEADVLEAWGGAQHVSAEECSAVSVWAEVGRSNLENPADVWPLAQRVTHAMIPSPVEAREPAEPARLAGPSAPVAIGEALRGASGGTGPLLPAQPYPRLDIER